jgi:D-alanyl-D-alanine carboxypeptidase (penicillin-binding protein 5/6)
VVQEPQLHFLKVWIAPAVMCLAAAFSLLAPQVNARVPHSSVSAQIPSQDDIPIAMLVDLSSGQILHQHNADRRFIPASITKVMTTYLAFELLDAGTIRRTQRFPVQPQTFRDWRGVGSTMFLGADAEPTVNELLRGITTVSANDASVVLAEGAAGSVAEWTAMMNATARELGMENSHFGTPNGWPDEGKTFVTARDLTILAQAMILRHSDLYSQFVGKPEYEFGGIKQPNHDPLLGNLRGADGIKTGFTNEAGYGFLGSAKRDGIRLVMVVAGADRASIRNRAARSYMEWGFTQFDRKLLFAKNEVVANARVQVGNAQSVGLISTRDIYATMPKSVTADISVRLHYTGPIRAPIMAGEEAGYLEVSVDGMPTIKVPLVAQTSVERAGPISRIANGLAGWFW